MLERTFQTGFLEAVIADPPANQQPTSTKPRGRPPKNKQQSTNDNEAQQEPQVTPRTSERIRNKMVNKN